MGGRKGQVSLFIILGVVLLGVVIGVYFLMQSPQEKINRPTENIPEELVPVKVFVDSCLNDISKRALVEIGKNGGYIDTRKAGLQTFTLNPTESDAFTYSSQSRVAYWHYLKSPNTCTECSFSSAQPPLDSPARFSVRSQMQNFILEELPLCLNNFETLNAAGYTITPVGAIAPEVVFTDNTVEVFMTYPLSVTVSGRTSTVTQYEASLVVPFKKMYDAASLITAADAKYNFLERHTLELIQVHAGIDRQSLPPTSASTFEFSSPVFWPEPEVRQKIDILLSSYVPALQVRGSRNYQPMQYSGGSESRAVQKLLDNMVLPLDAQRVIGFTDYDVTFDYPYLPMYFATNDQGVIKPSSVSIDWIPFFGIQRYNTLYDVSYPVRVSVFDPEAFEGEGYLLAFGLESNVRNNKPLFEGQQAQAMFADEPTQLCDPMFFTSANVTISVIDGLTGGPAKDTQILYDCGFASCAMGATDENGMFEGPFPVCANGQVVLLTDGRSSVRVDAAPSLNVPVSMDLRVEPMRTKQVAIDVHRLVKATLGEETWQRSQAQGLDLDESVMVFFTEVSGSYVTFDIFNGTEAPNAQHTIELMPGTYVVSAQAMLENKANPLVFEPQKYSAGGGIFGGEDVYVPENITTIDSAFLGGYALPEGTEAIEFSAGNLDAGQTIVVPVVIYDLKSIDQSRRKLEDLSAANDYKQYITINGLTPVVR